VQDPTLESTKKWKKISFELLELEMADLERFWRKTPLGPLGVKNVENLLINPSSILMSSITIAYSSAILMASIISIAYSSANCINKCPICGSLAYIMGNPQNLVKIK
jgi:hypothetical protein